MLAFKPAEAKFVSTRCKDGEVIKGERLPSPKVL
jgi:hypothetical protein